MFSDGFETTGDALEDWHYSRVEADLEMAEMQRAAAEAEADRQAGFCHHNGGYGYRPVAFYPQQVGLLPHQMFCVDCSTVVDCPWGPDCVHCDLDRYNCTGERGYSDHDFTPPPPVASVAPPEGF